METILRGIISFQTPNLVFENRSTIDQLVRLSSEINMTFMEKKAIGAIFLDLEKTFDLMWSTGTLVKLNKIGINGHMLNWIQHFLKGRKIQVRLGENMSDKIQFRKRLPPKGVYSVRHCLM